MLALFYCRDILFILISVHFCRSQIIDLAEDDEPEFVPRVVNGKPAKLGDVPYQLAFKTLISRAKKLYATFCGGTIIGPTKVLSAAHCFQKRGGISRCCTEGKVGRRKLQKSVAVAGNLNNIAKFQRKDSAQNGQWRSLKSMYIARNYKFPRNDICVGYTKKPFKFDANVASIPFAKTHIEYKGECLVSGYGRISKWEQTDKLLKAKLKVLPSSWCSKRHRKNMRKFICTSNKVSDVQKGDSGGPLVCEGKVVGVVSGNLRRVGSFFTRVSSFRKFIETGGQTCGLRSSLVLMCLPIFIIWRNIAILILFYVHNNNK